MAAPKKSTGLGSGLGNLFGENTRAFEEETKTGISSLPLEKIEPNPDQPRKIFEPQSLDELSQSIRQHGVITPIAVRKVEGGEGYQIIAGERRWRAARQAGLREIPAHVLEANQLEAIELALIENLQRENLNPIEQAEGYDQLMRDFGLTQEEVAQRVAKSRSAVANILRLLALPDGVRAMVAQGKLSSGHARAVLAINDPSERMAAAHQMQTMTVRQAETLAKRLNRKKKEEQTEQTGELTVDYYGEAARELEGALGRKVSIQQGKHSGSLTLEYYSAEDLERLLEALRTLHV